MLALKSSLILLRQHSSQMVKFSILKVETFRDVRLYSLYYGKESIYTVLH